MCASRCCEPANAPSRHSFHALMHALRRRMQQIAELTAQVPGCRAVNRDQCAPAGLPCSFASAHRSFVLHDAKLGRKVLGVWECLCNQGLARGSLWECLAGPCLRRPCASGTGASPTCASACPPTSPPAAQGSQCAPRPLLPSPRMHTPSRPSHGPTALHA